MKLVALILILKFYSTNCYDSTSRSVTIEVNRRYSLDIYMYMELGKPKVIKEVCGHSYPTYMVEEQQCVNDENFFDMCHFALNDSLTSNRTLYMPWGEALATGVTIIDTNQQTNIPLNISSCQIATLEVFRGKENVTEINHSGFTLTDGNTLQVEEQTLAYNSSEYVGELFHMKLSCFQEGQQQSECLFFKVGGKINVTKPKFNCAVPGTLYDNSLDCPSKLTISTDSVNEPLTEPEAHQQPMTSTNIRNSTLVTATSLNELHPSKFEVGSKLFDIVVGVGGGTVTLLILCLCCVCAVLICRRHRIKVSAITSTEMERRISTASRQTEAKNEKDTDLELYIHMYAVPSEVIRSNINTYGCNCLEDNPAYLEPGGCSEKNHGKSEEKLECSYAIIPAEKGLDLCDHDRNKEEPLYQEIIPRAELKSSLQQSKETPHASVETAENVFYQTSLHLQHQW